MKPRVAGTNVTVSADRMRSPRIRLTLPVAIARRHETIPCGARFVAPVRPFEWKPVSDPTSGNAP